MGEGWMIVREDGEEGEERESDQCQNVFNWIMDNLSKHLYVMYLYNCVWVIVSIPLNYLFIVILRGWVGVSLVSFL